LANAPLAGIRVLELCTGAAGPTVARSLAEYGAEVLKVESRKHPDNHRGGFNQARWNKSPTFVKLNRGKKSVTLNLQTDRGRQLALDLARRCDVVVDNFSLGVMERWGLGYEAVRAAKPDIVYISLKGLGNTGPHAKHVTWGPNLLCLFGMTYLWNDEDAGAPTSEARVQHPDFMAGVAGAGAVLAALLHRARTGQGQFIDSAQIEVGANLLGPAYLDYNVNGRVTAPAGNRRAGSAPHGAYPCVDGPEGWCAISVRTQDEWLRLCAAIGDPDWCREPRFESPLQRLRNREALDALLGEWTRRYTGLEIMERLQAAGVAAAPIQDVEDQLFHDPHFAARGLFVTVTEPEAGDIVAEHPPVWSSEGEACVRTPAPVLGQHTDVVLRTQLNLSDREIDELRDAGVLE